MQAKMKDIPQPYKALIEDFVALLKDAFGHDIVSAVLYGSVARGTSRKDSDIDICLVFESLPSSRHKRTLLIFPEIKALREKESYKALFAAGYLPEISPVLYTVEDIQDTKPIFLDMTEEGIILFDDGTIEKKLAAIRERMAELNSRKVVLENGDYYWILKPGLRLSEEVSL